MKKTVLVFFVLILCASCLFAVNSQKVWSTDSAVFKAVEELYILQGLALPSGSGPWSSAEISIMLDRVNPSVSEKLYNFVKQSLSEKPNVDIGKGMALDLGAKANVTDYFHSNTEFENPFFSTSNYLYDQKNRDPFLSADAQVWTGDNLYGYFEFYYAKDQLRKNTRNNTYGFFEKNFNHNIAVIDFDKFSLAMMDMSFPRRAFVSFGAENWNVDLGRDRIKWGSGESGNLTISDNMPYQDFLKASVFGQKLKYTYLISFYPHRVNYYSTWNDGSNEVGIEYYMGHRLEGRLFKDKFTFAVTEAVIYQDEEGNPLLRILSPVNFYHNDYVENHNSTFALEACYSPVSHISVFGQFLVDDLRTPTEKEDDTPNAMGFLFGAKTAWNLSDYYLKGSFEFAYTNPYTYLRSKVQGGTQDASDYGMGYNVALKIYGKYYEFMQGYTYGCDCIAFNAKAELDDFNKLSCGTSLLYIIHGEKGLDGDYLYELKPDLQTPSGTASHFIDWSVYAKYNVLDNLTLDAQLDIAKYAGEFETQFVLGATYTFF